MQREIIHCTLALIVNFADILQNDLCHIAFLFPLVCTGSPSLLPGRTARYTGYDTGFFFPFPPLSGKSFVKSRKSKFFQKSPKIITSSTCQTWQKQGPGSAEGEFCATGARKEENGLVVLNFVKPLQVFSAVYRITSARAMA
ncbi:hypothetical protein [Allofournierella massiliensis]|uniref:hypothetical protein n=1 Tax=Allofournierella massiliensis TaxID=1650663 RepID=UPI003566005B